MAESLSHKFGQIIGNVLEACIGPELQRIADKHGLYLDKKGPRRARTGVLVSWYDKYENKHDLDFVLERGGTQSKRGTPVAFIETAWRRYTKHSKNKAQEIQAAILPLQEGNWKYKPFMGVVLAGEFTGNALTQLESSGFVRLYFPYETVVKAFSLVGIDADFDEDTAVEVFSEKIDQWEALSDKQQDRVATKLGELNSTELKTFLSELEKSITRQVISVRVTPLRGIQSVLENIVDAISFIEKHDEMDGQEAPLVKYEVIIDFNTGAYIRAEFPTKWETFDFLNLYRSAPRPAK